MRGTGLTKTIDILPVPPYNRNMDRSLGGIAASIVGIVCNVLLSAAKISVGLLCGLVSVTADGINNFSDCASGVVALVSFCISEKPADRGHPFGHRRAEYIAAMLTGFLILLAAAELIRASAESIARGELAAAPWPVFLVLGLSVLVKSAMFFYYRARAKRLGSGVLMASAADSLSDCVATAAVLIGTGLSAMNIPADGYTGLVVALFIVWQGVKVLRDASSELLGRALDRTLTRALGACILSYQCVRGYHDLRVFTYGHGVAYATVHVEMDARIPALRSHAILDAMEHAALQQTGVILTTHLDPVDLTDGAADALKEEVTEAAREAIGDITLNDFRIVRGAAVKVIFEATIPFGCKMKDGAVRSVLEDIVKARGDYVPIVTVERE